MKSSIASFERIWAHTKHKGHGSCSPHGATVKLSSKYFLLYGLTNSPFPFLVYLAIVNIFAHTRFADCCKLEILLLASCQL